MHRQNRLHGLGKPRWLILTVATVMVLGIAVVAIRQTRQQPLPHTARSAPMSAATQYPSPGSTNTELKSFTLSYSNLTFQYPATWTMRDTSNPATGDDIDLMGTNNFHIDLFTTRDGLAVGAGPRIRRADPVSFTGEPAYLLLYGDTDDGTDVTAGVLAPNPTDGSGGYAVPYVHTGLSSQRFFVTLFYGESDNVQTKSLTDVVNDPNYARAKAVITSIHG